MIRTNFITFYLILLSFSILSKLGNAYEISVAIKYDAIEHSAPIVVAKGSGDIAMKIREIAKEHGIPIVEDKPLARVLNKTVEIGQQIPDNLFKAVAEILAYVYQLKSGLNQS